MTAHTTLLEFSLPEPPIGEAWDATVQTLSTHFLKNFDLQLVHTTQSNNGMLALFTGSQGRHVLARGDGKLLTLDLHEALSTQDTVCFTQKVVENLQKELKTALSITASKSLPTLRRGENLECYFPSSDNKLIEYDFDRCSFHQQSQYQDVLINHSQQFGNVLILDGDVNLAESDLAYTHAIMGYGNENYQDKTVLILGGGDGSLLHELLKENPGFITMVDIDEVVVKAAAKHLRGLCGDSLDKLTGPNYEVLIEDCIPILNKYIEEGREFDYVINDLTAIPVTTQPIGDQWDFLRMILDLSMKVLKPTGRYYTQGNGANMKSALAMYEHQLTKLVVPVEFSTQTVCVPSYHELWVFYKLWKKS